MVSKFPGFRLSDVSAALRDANAELNGGGKGGSRTSNVVEAEYVVVDSPIPAIAAKPEDGLRERIRELENELRIKISELSKVTADLKTVEGKLASLEKSSQTDSANFAAERRSLETQISDLNARVLAKVAEVLEKSNLLDNAKKETAFLRKRVEGLQIRENFGKELLRELSKVLKGLNSDAKEMQADVDRLSRELREAKEREENLKQDVAALEADGQNEIRSYETQLDAAKNREIVSARKLRRLRRSHQQQTTRIESLSEEIGKKQGEIRGHILVIKKLKKDLEDLRKNKEIDDATSRREIDNLVKRLSDLNIVAKKRLESIDDLYDEIETLNESNIRLQSELDTLRPKGERLDAIDSDWKDVGSGRAALMERPKIPFQGVDLSPLDPKSLLARIKPVVKEETVSVENTKSRQEQVVDPQVLKFREQISRAETFADIFSVLDEIYPITRPLAFREKYQDTIRRIKDARLAMQKAVDHEARNKIFLSFQIPDDKYGVTDKVLWLLRKIRVGETS